jgi:hypothetical protein
LNSSDITIKGKNMPVPMISKTKHNKIVTELQERIQELERFQHHGGMPRQQAEDEAAEEIRAQNALAIPRERP